MFGEKKNRSQEVKWIVTFADLITLLFCFFVYLSLFNKPQVDLKTGFIVDEETTKSLTGRLPDNVVSALDSMKGELFEIRGPFEARLEKIIGQKLTDENTEISKKYNLNLPESLAAAYKISNSENPDLQISMLEYKQAKLDVIIAGSDFSPSATLSYKIAEQDDISSTVQDRTQQTVKATATWPLFSGGSNIFNLRKAKELRNLSLIHI